ncbi:Rv3235 family protein [Actinacidiphila sp. bgisy167]|uniref:Rv3235 family protein n=1 Tax=Actinacidiphila sp. bgisy167 TaxID=3413797 RepID=UPI003D75F524
MPASASAVVPGSALTPAPSPAPSVPRASAPSPARHITALPPHVWFAGRLLEVLTGRRPITSLAGRMRPEAYDRLWDLVGARADWRYVSRGHLPRLLKPPRVSPVPDGAAVEVCAVVLLTPHVVRALAFRLERTGPEGREEPGRPWPVRRGPGHGGPGRSGAPPPGAAPPSRRTDRADPREP